MPESSVRLSIPSRECPTTPVRVAGSPAQPAVLYLDRLDSRSVGLRRLGSLVPPDAQCSATSLTMSLLSLYGGDRQALLAECRSLATEQGQALARDRAGRRRGRGRRHRVDLAREHRRREARGRHAPRSDGVVVLLHSPWRTGLRAD